MSHLQQALPSHFPFGLWVSSGEPFPCQGQRTLNITGIPYLNTCLSTAWQQCNCSPYQNQEVWATKNRSSMPVPWFHIPTVSFLRKDRLLFICTLCRTVLFGAVNVILEASSNTGSWLRLKRTTTNGKKKLAGKKWKESKTMTEKEFSRMERRKADNEKILRRKETENR